MELIVLIGLPGAGKSTYAKNYIDNEVTKGNLFWAYCSSDKIRKKLYGDENIQGKPDTVFKNLHQDVEHYLNNGTNVVYDATNVSRKNRKQIIQLGKKYKCIIRAIVVWAPVEVCIERDKLRDRTVSESVIMRMLKRFEVPYFDEGFNTIAVHNSVENFDEVAYNSKLFEDMKISHDNPYHTYDVYDHCMSAEEFARDRYSCVVTQAAKYHDCGKPLAKFFKENESTAHYYNHDNIGGYLVLGIKDLASTPIIPWLISNHMQPFFNSNYYKELPSSLKIPLDQLHDCDLNAH